MAPTLADLEASQRAIDASRAATDALYVKRAELVDALVVAGHSMTALARVCGVTRMALQFAADKRAVAAG